MVAVHKDVVDDLVVAPTAQESRALHLEEDIAENLRAAHAVVHVNAHRTHSDAAGVVNEIVTNSVPLKGVVAPGIDGADVPGLQGDVMDLVEFDEMIVAAEENRAMRVIMNEVVRDEQPHSLQQNRGDIALGPAALPGEVAVFHVMPAGCEGPPVAAFERDAAVAGIQYFGAHDAVTASSLNHHPRVADVSNQAAGDAVAQSSADFDRVGTRRLERQVDKSHVRNVCQLQQWLREQGKKDLI